MNMRFVLINLAFTLISITTLAQGPGAGRAEDESTFFDRVYIGGNFSMQFGDITAVDLSPLVGYRFSETFSAGPGFTYQYFNDKRFDFSTDIIGYRIFGRKMLNEQLFAYAEYENLKLEYFDPFAGEIREGWVPGVLAGGGLFQPIGRSAGVMLTVLYNLSYDDIKSPYASPLIVRAGFTL